MTEEARKIRRRRWIAGWSAIGLVAAGVAVGVSNTAASATTNATVQPLSTGIPSPTPAPTATPTPTPTTFPNGQHLTFSQSPANPVAVGTTVTYTVTLLTPRTSVTIDIDNGRLPSGPLNYGFFGAATAPGGGESTVLTLQHTWTTSGSYNLVATLSSCDIYDCGGAQDFTGLSTVVGSGATPAPPTVTPTPTPTPFVTPTPVVDPTPAPAKIGLAQSPAGQAIAGSPVTYTATTTTARTSVGFYEGTSTLLGTATPVDASGQPVSSGTRFVLTHAWPTPGNYTVTATVSSCNGLDCGARGDYSSVTTTVVPAPTPKVTPTPNVTPEPTRIPEPVVVSFNASASVTVPSIGGTAAVAPSPVPIRVTINALKTGFTITPSQPTLAPAKITGTVFGFIPWSVTESITATAPVSGTITSGVATATAPVQVSITAASLAGIAMSGATSCHTVKSSPLTLTSTTSLGAGSSGGTLAGSFTPGQFSGCGNFTSLLNSLYAGAAQQVTLKLS